MVRRLPAVRHFPLRLVLAGAVLAALLAGCGRAGRDKAREQIKQSRQSLTAPDFLKAAAAGDQAMVTTFLRAGIDRNIGDERGYTALMSAAERGHKDTVKLLLDENARPDLQNKEGDTALILAAAANQPDCVRTLIEGNADVRIKDQKNWTALMKGVFSGYEDVVDALLATSRDALKRDGQLDRALSVAALLGNTGMVRSLLEHGADINATTIDNKQTALMYAAAAGKRETVQLLLDRGADTKLVNAEGSSASILALQRGFPEVAKMIDGGSGPSTPAVAAATPAPINPQPTSSEAQTKQAAADAASVALERTWLKENGVEPSKLINKDIGQDDDHDGYTNDEELAAGTDPNDPNSHPTPAAKLRMKKLSGEPFPVMFDGVEGRKAKVKIKAADGEHEATISKGERLPNVPYTVSSIRSRAVTEKDTGRPVDASELTLSNVETGEKVVLVRSMPAGPNTAAVLSTGAGNPEIEVKAGQKFSLPVDPKTEYQVLDIRPTQVIIRAVGTKQTYTVPMSPAQ